MNVVLKIEGGVVQWTQVEGLKDGNYSVKFTSLDTRTGQQNSALHLWLTMIANALNAAGLDINKTIVASIDWRMETVKELMWRRIQKTITTKESSANLTKEEFAETQETLNRVLGERYGIHVPFPSMEEKENG
jgi:hypothetical protein